MSFDYPLVILKHFLLHKLLLTHSIGLCYNGNNLLYIRQAE